VTDDAADKIRDTRRQLDSAVLEYPVTASTPGEVFTRATMLARYLLLSCVRSCVIAYVRPSVCLSHASIVPKRLNVGSRK